MSNQCLSKMSLSQLILEQDLLKQELSQGCGQNCYLKYEKVMAIKFFINQMTPILERAGSQFAWGFLADHKDFFIDKVHVDSDFRQKVLSALSDALITFLDDNKLDQLYCELQICKKEEKDSEK